MAGRIEFTSNGRETAIQTTPGLRGRTEAVGEEGCDRHQGEHQGHERANLKPVAVGHSEVTETRECHDPGEGHSNVWSLSCSHNFQVIGYPEGDTCQTLNEPHWRPERIFLASFIYNLAGSNISMILNQTCCRSQNRCFRRKLHYRYKFTLFLQGGERENPGGCGKSKIPDPYRRLM